MDTLKFFGKMWLYFICLAIGLTLIAGLTMLAADYSFLLGLLVFVIGIGGLFSAIMAVGLRG